MKFWLITLGLISATDDYIPTPSLKLSHVGFSPAETTPITPSSYTYLKPEETDYYCLHRILSTFSDNLCDIYYEFKSVKELWEAFEEEYGLDDVGIDQFTSSSKFMMVHNKLINNQLHEFQDCIQHLQSKGN